MWQEQKKRTSCETSVTDVPTIIMTDVPTIILASSTWNLFVVPYSPIPIYKSSSLPKEIASKISRSISPSLGDMLLG